MIASTRNTTRAWWKRRGNIAVGAAVFMIPLLGVLALSLDGGALMAERRRAQAAADAAAMSAACDLFDNYFTNSGDDPSGAAADSAKATAAANGYNNDGTTSKVTVNIPPTSGPYTNVRGYVEVIVEYYQRRTFSNIFSSGVVTVRARAVAVGSAIAADVGILVLDPTKRASFNAQGGGVSDVNGTPVIVNSKDSEAAVAGGGGTVKAEKFSIKGGYTTSGGGTFDGQVLTGQPGLADPLAYLPVPNPEAMPLRSHNRTHRSNGTLRLEPGVYKGGISVSGTASLELAPGIYYMDGGGFSFSGQGSLSGEGVMIYNAPGNGNSGGISVSGQGALNISGPTSGVYHGITFFQDRKSDVTGSISGSGEGGATSITGTFYFAGALLQISGNGGVANLGSQYISNELELGGNGGINIDWHPDKVARKRNLYLVE